MYDGVSSRLYNPVNQSWSQHWPGVNHLARENYLDDEERQRPLLSGSLTNINHRLAKIELHNFIWRFFATSNIAAGY